MMKSWKLGWVLETERKTGGRVFARVEGHHRSARFPPSVAWFEPYQVHSSGWSPNDCQMAPLTSLAAMSAVHLGPPTPTAGLHRISSYIRARIVSFS